MIIELSSRLSSSEIEEVLSKQKQQDVVSSVCTNGNGSSFVSRMTYLKGWYPIGKQIISGITGQPETVVEERYVKPVITVEVTEK